MWGRIKGFFTVVFAHVKPVAKGAFNAVEPIVIAVAKEEATKLACTDMSSSDKRAAAFKAVKSRVRGKAGQQVKTSLINYAIELAVKNLG